MTHDKNFQAGGCLITHSLEEAIKLTKTKDKKEIFIIGGGQIYEQAINIADKVYLTVVKGKYDAATFLPDYSFSQILCLFLLTFCGFFQRL